MKNHRRILILLISLMFLLSTAGAAAAYSGITKVDPNIPVIDIEAVARGEYKSEKYETPDGKTVTMVRVGELTMIVLDKPIFPIKTEMSIESVCSHPYGQYVSTSSHHNLICTSCAAAIPGYYGAHVWFNPSNNVRMCSVCYYTTGA